MSVTPFTHYQEALANRARVASRVKLARESAVVVPLAFLEGEEHLLLAKRADNLASHPGQMCFPGGKPHPEDPTLWHTAVREAQEELGLPPESFTLVGELDDVHTITNFLIRPFVAVTSQPYPLTPDQSEVETAFWVPVRDLLDPANYESRDMLRVGKQSYTMQVFTVSDPPVWGATARILRNLLNVVHGWEDPSPNVP